MADESKSEFDDAAEDDFGDLDLSEMERGGEAIDNKKSYQDYTSSGGRVVVREEFAKKAATGESATETKILKAIIIALALLVPALTIYFQMGGGDEPAEERDKAAAEAD